MPHVVPFSDKRIYETYAILQSIKLTAKEFGISPDYVRKACRNIDPAWTAVRKKRIPLMRKCHGCGRMFHAGDRTRSTPCDVCIRACNRDMVFLKELAIDMRRMGYETQEISDVVMMGKSTMTTWLKGTDPEYDWRERIRELRAAGVTNKELYRHYGWSKHQVHNAFKDYAYHAPYKRKPPVDKYVDNSEKMSHVIW